MKRLALTLAVALITALSASAQRLTNIRAEARFITDKMVLELGLTNVQRNSILQLNLGYLDAINSYRDINGKAWKHRNKELRRMMSDRQWRRYKESYYFYQPISWRSNAYVHNIYTRYPERVVVVHESCKPCKHHKHYESCKHHKHHKHDKHYKHHKHDKHDKHYKHYKHDKHHKHDKYRKYDKDDRYKKYPFGSRR